MANYQITAPDGTKYQITAPDSATQDQVLAYAQQQHVSAPKPQPNSFVDSLRSIPGGLAKSAAGLIGLPGDVSNLANKGMDYLTGADVASRHPAMVTSENVNKALSAPTKGYYQPQTTAGKYAETIASFAPGAIGGGGLVAKALRVAIPGGASETAGQVTRGTPYEPYARLGAAVAAGGRGGLKNPESDIPTTEELFAKGSDAYAKVGQSGMVVAGQSLKNLAGKIENDLANEGFDATLHPGTARALTRIQQAADTTNPAGGNVTLPGIDILRKVTNQVGGANVLNKADAHMARIVRQNIDEYLSGLQPSDAVGGKIDPAALASLKEARSTWQTAKKSQIIDDTMAKAELDASQYSQSGLENTVRRNFKALAKSPKFRQFSPQEQSAITKIVQGTPISNALRYFGKFAPHGPVALAVDAGVGGMAGKTGAVAMMGIGHVAKKAAAASTTNRARSLSEMVRNGGVPVNSDYAAALLNRVATPTRITAGALSQQPAEQNPRKLQGDY
jgi:hypothetical protein